MVDGVVKNKKQDTLDDFRIKHKRIEDSGFKVITREDVDRLGLLSKNGKFLVTLFRDNSGSITLMEWGITIGFDSLQRINSLDLTNKNVPAALKTAINLRQVEAIAINITENSEVQEKLKKLKAKEEPDKQWEKIDIKIFKTENGWKTNTGVDDIFPFTSREKELIITMSKNGHSVRFIKTGENALDKKSWQPAYHRITNKDVASGNPLHIEELQTTLNLLLQSREFRETLSNLKYS